jgi:hypothetical protein
MISEKPAPDLIRGGHLFLGKDHASYDAFGRPYAAAYCDQVFRKVVGVNPVR